MSDTSLEHTIKKVILKPYFEEVFSICKVKITKPTMLTKGFLIEQQKTIKTGSQI